MGWDMTFNFITPIQKMVVASLSIPLFRSSFLLFLCVRFVKITLKNKIVYNKYTHKLKTKPFPSFHPYNFFQVINQNIRWFFYVGKIASSKHYFSFMYSMFIVPFMFKSGTPLDLQQQEHCLDSGLFIYF